MVIKSKLLIASLLFLLINGCQSGRLDIDVSKVDFSVNYYNIDSLFHNKELKELKQEHLLLEEKLSDLYMFELSYNFKQIYQRPISLDSNVADRIVFFYNQDFIKDIEAAKSKTFYPLTSLEAEINGGFKHLKHHMPQAKMPQEILWMNNLFAKVHSSDSAIAVGLEYYLGKDNELVKSIPTEMLYDWQRKRMNLDYLPRDILQSWMQANLFKPVSGKLIEHIIQAGKLVYMVEACFPNAPKEEIIKYTEEELNYAFDNEGKFWRYLVEKNLFFENSERDKSNLLNEGPYTVGLPDDSPDRMGQFLGWQMVKSFMDKNEDVSLLELVNTEYNKILQSYDTK